MSLECETRHSSAARMSATFSRARTTSSAASETSTDRFFSAKSDTLARSSSEKKMTRFVNAKSASSLSTRAASLRDRSSPAAPFLSIPNPFSIAPAEPNPKKGEKRTMGASGFTKRCPTGAICIASRIVSQALCTQRGSKDSSIKSAASTAASALALSTGATPACFLAGPPLGRITVPLPTLYSSIVGVPANAAGDSASSPAAAPATRSNARRESDGAPPSIGEEEHWRAQTLLRRRRAGRGEAGLRNAPT
mmetsp:Transcript_28876/g.68897  ORF Transcript_28876/g.68897 Transcript_28876/m.68897 type:complete len:251 (+) Transcript_28876:187-939(+)